MTESMRLFYAVVVRDPALKRLAECAEDLRGSGADVKWVRAETLHMTLAFLGATPSGRLRDAAEAGREAAAATKAHDAAFTYLGAFPAWSRPKVLWAGLGLGADDLSALAGRLHAGLKRAEFAFDERPFVPHATLGRVRSSRGLEELSKRAEPWLRPEAWVGADFQVGDLVLFNSTLAPQGPVYEALERFPLGLSRAPTTAGSGGAPAALGGPCAPTTAGSGGAPAA